MHVCAVCGVQLSKTPGPGRWPKWCVACRTKKGRPRKPKRLAVCGICGASFMTHRARYCSRRCRTKASNDRPERREAARAYGRRHYAPRCAVSFVVCGICGALFAARSSRAKTCKRADCQKHTAADRMREYFRAQGGNKWRKPEHSRASYERTKAQFGSARKRWPDSARKGDATRRARKFAEPRETFDPYEIFKRDGWVCGICDLAVDPDEKWPEPGSPSLDHIVPLSKGGPHTRANTRLAHLYCNTVRGNREVA